MTAPCTLHHPSKAAQHPFLGKASQVDTGGEVEETFDTYQVATYLNVEWIAVCYATRATAREGCDTVWRARRAACEVLCARRGIVVGMHELHLKHSTQSLWVFAL